MSNKKTLYLLYTGNSCRSQMAEGIEGEKRAVFQRIRDEIDERMKHFAETGE
ncbi:MAG TPA: hypothetical protein GX497_10320 [Bacillus bacterium]|nr:hypothetical protein [Bacillus sp. (in: firmicutes)]